MTKKKLFNKENAACAKIAQAGQFVPKWNKLNYSEFPDSSKLMRSASRRKRK